MQGATGYLRLLLLLFGLSFYWLWLLSGIFSRIVWYGDISFGNNWAWLITIVANGFALISACYLSYKKRLPAERPLFSIVAAIITATGIAFVSIAYNVSGFAHLLYPGCVLTGLGAGFLILFWRHASQGVSSKKVRFILFAVSVVMSILFYLLIVSLPFAIALIFCTLSPIISALMLIRASPKIPVTSPSFDSKIIAKTINPHDSTRQIFFVLLILCCIILSIAQGIYQTGGNAEKAQLAWTLIISCVDVVICGILAIESLCLRRRQSSGIYPRLFLPLTTAISLSLPLFLSDLPLFSHAVIIGGNVLLLIFMYSAIDAFSFTSRVPVETFALLLLSGNIGCLIGMLTRMYAKPFFMSRTVGIVYAFCAIVICFLYARQSLKMDAESTSDSDEENGWLSLFDDQSSDQLSAISMADNVGRLCHMVAEYYALSAREEEIMNYLVRGKSIKTIAQNIDISRNTIKTHVKHIYQKLDTHTREDLIDIVESFDKPE